MGLGKTRQAVAMMGYLKSIKKVKQPMLIVAPLTLFGTWEAELTTTCPSLKVLTMHGDKSRRSVGANKMRKGSCDIILTAYTTLLLLPETFQTMKWAYMVLDEGHRLKKPIQKQRRYCRR